MTGLDQAAVVATDDASDIPTSRADRSHAQFDDLIARASALAPVPYAVIWPCEAHALAGPIDAARRHLIRPLLVGEGTTIRNVAAAAGIDLGDCELVEAPHPAAAAASGVQLVREGRVRGLMKGSLHTDILMHAALGHDSGLSMGRRASHVFVIAVPGYDRLIFVTDAAINIAPDLATKRDIVQNAIDLYRGLGLGRPRVAILSAVETVNPKIPGTVDAAALCKMAERGQITGGVLDGPLAMDNAVDPEAAAVKGIVSDVAGRADILVAPDLEAGNMLAKNLIFMAHADSAGIVLGSKVPILLSSRADSVQARLASAAVGALYADSLSPDRSR